MSEKVKVEDKILYLLKQVVYIPSLLLLPIFIMNPSCSICLLLCLLIVYYFLCFMGPIYILRYFIQKLNLNQKIVNIFSKFILISMYIFSLLNFGKLLFLKDTFESFPTYIFLIPFFAFLRCVQIMIIAVFGISIFNYLSNKSKKKES